MKRIAILQSNYIPWKGYFDLINMVDEFIIYDDMQYTRRDWRNRNKIKTPEGLKWLTIPVEVKGKYFQTIKDTVISEDDWAVKHWQTIKQFYSKAPYWKIYRDIFECFYLNTREKYLSKINFELIKIIAEILHITTHIRWSSEFELIDGQNERLFNICQQAKANIYLSGPAAKDYFNENIAKRMGINVEWMDYSGYPEYPQFYPPFEHGVTILDLIFHTGQNAKKFMKSFK